MEYTPAPYTPDSIPFLDHLKINCLAARQRSQSIWKTETVFMAMKIHEHSLDQERGRSADLRQAAAELGHLRKGYRRNRHRKKVKRWTGYMADGQRAWYGRKVTQPNGRIVSIYGIVRGWAGITWDDPAGREGLGMALLRVEQLTAYKLPAAVSLGSAKAGVTERPSVAKAKAARLNGGKPPRPGKRRGRPRKIQAI